MESKSTELKAQDRHVPASGNATPQEPDVLGQLIEQEAARLSSLAIRSALDYLRQENDSRYPPAENLESAPDPILARSSNETTIPITERSGEKPSTCGGGEGGIGEASACGCDTEEDEHLNDVELIDIEEFLISEAENLFYAELCPHDQRQVTGSGEGQYVTLPPNPLRTAGEMEANSCDCPKRLINLDWAKAKEFKPRRPTTALQISEPNSTGPSDTDNNSASGSSERDGKYYNNNNCHDRITTVKLISQTDDQIVDSQLIYHDALDLSVEDNSQSEVLDIIVVPDTSNAPTANRSAPNSGCPTSGGVAFTNTSFHKTKPATNHLPPPPPPPAPRPSRTAIHLSTSRVPINMIFPVRPPCRPPFNIPHPSLPPFRQPFLHQLPVLPPHPPTAHPVCPPHLSLPVRYPVTDCAPFYSPPPGCFYPPDGLPPPGIQYGYSQRGKRRKAQRLSSRFPTQAGKFHHHANFYVKSCAESVVARRAKLESQQNFHQPPVSRSH